MDSGLMLQNPISIHQFQILNIPENIWLLASMPGLEMAKKLPGRPKQGAKYAMRKGVATKFTQGPWGSIGQDQGILYWANVPAYTGDSCSSL